MAKSGRAAAVLGGSGFIGSALVRRLLKDQRFDRIIVVDDLSAGSKSLMIDDPLVEFINKDVKHMDMTELGFPDPVYYLCASPYVPDSYENPERTMERNVDTLASFLTINSHHMPQVFVYASSGEVYGSVSNERASESEALSCEDLARYSPYTQSRGLAEEILGQLGPRGHKSVVALRLFNVIGPGATHRYFVPDIIQQAFTSETIAHGNLDAIRDFVWIDDTVDAFVRASLLNVPGILPINVSSGLGWTMRSVLNEILRSSGRHKFRLELDESRLRRGDLMRLVGCTSNAWNILGWRCKVSMPEAVRCTIEAYRECQKWPYEQ